MSNKSMNKTMGTTVLTPRAPVMDANLLFQSGYLSHQKGDLPQAERWYKQALILAPRHPHALHMLGVLAAQVGQFDQATRLISEAVRHAPGDFSMLNNLGNALVKCERFAEAVEVLDRAVALVPDSPQVLNNRGNALLGLRRYRDAVLSYQKAIDLKPDYVDALCNQGKVYASFHFPNDALDCADKALAMAPDSLSAKTLRGHALVALQRAQEAMAAFGEVLMVDDSYADAHWGRGVALVELHQYAMAVESFERSLALKPALTEVYPELAEALFKVGRHRDALSAVQTAVERRPDNIKWVMAQVALQAKVCAWDQLQPRLDRLLAASRAGQLEDASAFAMLGISDDPQVNRLTAESTAKARYPVNVQLGAIAPRVAGDKTRVAYLSADLRDHAVGRLMAETLELHDHQRFEWVAFYCGKHKAGDTMHERVRASFDHFIDINDKNDVEVAQLARDMGVDILVDLTGYTSYGRPGILALRAAPVQVNYLGYPGTMGAPYVDYILADPVVIPPEARGHYTEKVVTLPHAYQPNDRKRVVAHTPTRAEAGLPDTGTVFACFNQNYKIMPATFDAWMRILQQVPGSVLWLLEDTPLVVENLRAEAVKRGVAGERIVFAKRVPPPEHLARQRLADLFLDTLPYNAHTTTSDALWVGLPVLTLQGQAFAGRVAASLLTAAGVPELITHTTSEYEALAVALALDPARLTALRERLLAQRDTCPLFDTPRLTRDIERAYEAMVQRHAQGLPPEHIALSA